MQLTQLHPLLCKKKKHVRQAYHVDCDVKPVTDQNLCWGNIFHYRYPQQNLFLDSKGRGPLARQLSWERSGLKLKRKVYSESSLIQILFIFSSQRHQTSSLPIAHLQGWIVRAFNYLFLSFRKRKEKKRGRWKINKFSPTMHQGSNIKVFFFFFFRKVSQKNKIFKQFFCLFVRNKF